MLVYLAGLPLKRLTRASMLQSNLLSNIQMYNPAACCCWCITFLEALQADRGKAIGGATFFGMLVGHA